MTERTFTLQIREAAAIGRGQDREARRIERHPMAGEAMQHLRRRLGNAFWRLCKPASGSAKAVNEHCSFILHLKDAKIVAEAVDFQRTKQLVLVIRQQEIGQR